MTSVSNADNAFLPFALPDIGEAEVAAVSEVLTSGWITTGPKTQAFEAAFAKTIGCRHAVAVNSCTAALHLALEAIGLQAGDEVVTSPYTFAATAEVIRYFGARPVFVDIDERWLNLRIDLVDAAITERTRAIIPVHIAGLPVDMDPLSTIARRHGLAVIEDAAHAFPAGYRGRMVGTLSDATCFSFYATKTVTTGEGGMLCTDDDQIAERARVMALHGISKDAWKRYSAAGSWYYEIVAPGFKYNMTDLSAAIGLVQLRKAEAMAARREQIARRYTDAFAHIATLQPPSDRVDSVHAWHLYMLRLQLDALTIDRAAFIEALKSRGIGSSVHFIPLHIHPYYRELYGYQPDAYPTAYREYLREVSLPIYSRMRDEEVARVIDAVTDIAQQYRKRVWIGARSQPAFVSQV